MWPRVIASVILSVVGLSPSKWGNIAKLAQGKLGGAPIGACEDFEFLLNQLTEISKQKDGFVVAAGPRRFELSGQDVQVEFPTRNCKHILLKEGGHVPGVHEPPRITHAA